LRSCSARRAAGPVRERTKRRAASRGRSRAVKAMTSGPVDAAAPWRATAAELAGTLLLVLVAAGGPTIAPTGNGHIERFALAIAPGLAVTALVFALRAVSRAHLNPVVTFTLSVPSR